MESKLKTKKPNVTVAIIPARKGSVGIPGKNHILLNGLRLIEYSIIAAINSKSIDDIIVSTDCPEIKKICMSYKNKLTVLDRPSHLAQNNSKSEDVVAHACDSLTKKGVAIGKIILLQPTSPLRSAGQIDESINLFEESKMDSLISVSEPTQHPFNFVSVKEGNIYYTCSRKERVSRRQDFPDAWFINGAIYITDYDFFSKSNLIYDLKRCTLYKMPIESSIDIDTPFDLKICSSLLEKYEEI